MRLLAIGAWALTGFAFIFFSGYMLEFASHARRSLIATWLLSLAAWGGVSAALYL